MQHQLRSYRVIYHAYAVLIVLLSRTIFIRVTLFGFRVIRVISYLIRVIRAYYPPVGFAVAAAARTITRVGVKCLACIAIQ